jgi:short-chain fatty acids transporter
MTSSSAQLQANAASIPPSLLPITGVIDFSQTILTWQNGLTILIVTALSALICYLTAPSGANSVTAEDLGVDLKDDLASAQGVARPGAYLEHSPVLSILICMVAVGWTWQVLTAGDLLAALSNLNTYNFIFLMLGILLHWRPSNLMQAFAKAVPNVSGILLQFPLYAATAQVLTGAPDANGVTLSASIAGWFVGLGDSVPIFSLIVGLYSAMLGLLIPSAGGKWVIEAPYVMAAANQIGAHLGWTVMVYNITETLPNLINPFWMLPLLGILRLHPKDLIGYTAIQFLVHLPIVLVLVSVLATTFDYHPPRLP